MYSQLRKTRVVIEQAWGIFKARFQCAKRCIRTNPTSAAAILKCCAILHNFLILQKDNWEFYELEEENDDAGADNGEDAGNQNRLALFNHTFKHINNIH